VLLWHGKVKKALGRLGELDRRIAHFTQHLSSLPTPLKEPCGSSARISRTIAASFNLAAVSERRDDFDGVCGVHRQLRAQQNGCKKAIDAVD